LQGLERHFNRIYFHLSKQYYGNSLSQKSLLLASNLLQVTKIPY